MPSEKPTILSIASIIKRFSRITISCPLTSKLPRSSTSSIQTASAQNGLMTAPNGSKTSISLHHASQLFGHSNKILNFVFLSVGSSISHHSKKHACRLSVLKNKNHLAAVQPNKAGLQIVQIVVRDAFWLHRRSYFCFARNGVEVFSRLAELLW